MHPLEWYLSIRKQRDVIEYPIHEDLDINGSGFKKALNLFRKSNPPLMEWLGSPIIYVDDYSIAGQMRKLAKLHYSPISSSYHYLQMARGNYKDYMRGESVWLKKYFYILRPILAVKWIEEGLGIVPTEFQVLVDRLVNDPGLKSAINDLIKAKQAGEELDRGPRIDSIAEFIEQELARFENHHFDYGKPPDPIGKLDKLFINTLEEVWGF